MRQLLPNETKAVTTKLLQSVTEDYYKESQLLGMSRNRKLCRKDISKFKTL